jgi:hypothetical protein
MASDLPDMAQVQRELNHAQSQIELTRRYPGRKPPDQW